MSAPNIQLPGYVKQLVAAGKLEVGVAEKTVKKAHADKISVMEWLFHQQLVSAKDLARAASDEYGISVVDLDAIDIRPTVIDLISDEQKQRLHLLPIYRYGNHLLVALADPIYLPNLDDVKFATNLKPEPVFVEFDKLQIYLANGGGFSGSASPMQSGMAVSSEAITQNIALDTRDIKKQEAEGEEVEIISFVDKLLAHAINSKVSDIHIEPYEKNLRIRYRVDGILKVIATPPIGIASQLTSRLKVLARMNISERRVPQDGRIRFALNEKKNIDFRVNTLPTIYGEKVVMRILDSDSATIGVEKLGFDPKQQADFVNALNKPDGMVLVTGPTGSGKTVTLYTGLGMLNTPETNISTAEDPAEINMPGVNQVNVNPKVGLTFAEALRAFLRQDPGRILRRCGQDRSPGRGRPAAQLAPDPGRHLRLVAGAVAQQALHRTGSAPAGSAGPGAQADCRGRCAGGELPPRHAGGLGHVARRTARAQPRPRDAAHLGLRPDGALPRPARFWRDW